MADARVPEAVAEVDRIMALVRRCANAYEGWGISCNEYTDVEVAVITLVRERDDARRMVVLVNAQAERMEPVVEAARVIRDDLGTRPDEHQHLDGHLRWTPAIRPVKDLVSALNALDAAAAPPDGEGGGS
jgi:hypothetical protein